jgi:DNA-directed RNA polymerase specialized sigma24 family protein
LSENDWLAGQFETHRGHLRGVAYRMLGTLSEADDAVQEAWLRLHRAGEAGIDNLGGWLTTTVSRVCLDMLRARKTRREIEPAQKEAAGRRAVPEGAKPEDRRARGGGGSRATPRASAGSRAGA